MERPSGSFGITIAASNSTPAIAVSAPVTEMSLLFGSVVMVPSFRASRQLDVSTGPTGFGSGSAYGGGTPVAAGPAHEEAAKPAEEGVQTPRKAVRVTCLA